MVVLLFHNITRVIFLRIDDFMQCSESFQMLGDQGSNTAIGGSQL